MYSHVFHWLDGHFLLMRVRSPRTMHSFNLYTASAEIWWLHSKWRQVKGSTEFRGKKRSNEIGPCCLYKNEKS